MPAAFGWRGSDCGWRQPGCGPFWCVGGARPDVNASLWRAVIGHGHAVKHSIRGIAGVFVPFTTYHDGSPMRKLIAVVIAGLFAVSGAFADEMKKDDTKKDEKKSEMKKDEKEKDEKYEKKADMKKVDKKDEMKKGEMKKDEMKKDEMKKDEMKKDETKK